MNRSPDLRIITKPPGLPLPLWAQWLVRRGTDGCSAPRLQWRDRVGLAPTSHIHRETSSY